MSKACIWWLGVVLATVGLHAAEPERIDVAGDVRLRVETDRDSHRADGSRRDDRTRVRMRVRLGATFRLAERVSFAARLRSGSSDSQQSPHVTLLDLDGGDTGDADFDLDRWSVRYRGDRWRAWAGRQDPGLWFQNEMVWDGDVTVAGLGGRLDRGPLSLRATWATPPAGMRRFVGELAALQLVHTREGARIGSTLAAGTIRLDGAPDDPDAALLRSGNGARDYEILVLSGQLRTRLAGRQLVAGVDLIRNAQRYAPDDPDPFTVANRDERDGLVVSLRWGELASPGDWQLRWDAARIETLAVNASFAEDDWVRWGSATQTDGTDLEGHELRYARRLAPAADVAVRLFVVDAISSVQDGTRLRVDLNYAF